MLIAKELFTDANSFGCPTRLLSFFNDGPDILVVAPRIISTRNFEFQKIGFVARPLFQETAVFFLVQIAPHRVILTPASIYGEIGALEIPRSILGERIHLTLECCFNATGCQNST